LAAAPIASAGNTSLVDVDGAAGYDRGFVVSDATGDNTLRFNLLSQFRYVWNQRRSDTAPGANDKTTVGFQTFEILPVISGTVFDKRLGYQVSAIASDLLTGISLLDAFGSWQFDESWRMRWGQFKPALLREFNLSPAKQLAMERSVINLAFAPSWVQGIDVRGQWDRHRFSVGVIDGFLTRNSDIVSSKEADFGVGVRGEWLLGGEDGAWSRFNDFTSFRGQSFAAQFGLAGYWQTGGATNGTIDADMYWWSSDLSFEGDGWNGMVAYVGRYIDAAGASGVYDQGLVVQGGVFATDRLEPYARWAAIIPGDRPSGDSTQNVVSVGGNYYFVPESHTLKLTTELSVFLNDTSSNVILPPNTGSGMLPDIQSGQFALRVQIQMLF